MRLIMLLLLFSSIASANSFFSEHARGWHWYEVIPLEEEKDKQISESASTNPVEVLNQLKEQIETLKAKAVLNPTEQNLKAYILAQNEVARKASLFSSSWQRVLWKNPELDYSLIKPTSFLGKQAYLDKQKVSLNQTAKSFAKDYGLWLFYRSDCPYCHKFAPIVKRFAESIGIHITAISMDGISIPDFPDSKVDQGQAEKSGVQVVPALFAVNPNKEEIIPVAHGLLTELELLERISAISNQEVL